MKTLLSKIIIATCLLSIGIFSVEFYQFFHDSPLNVDENGHVLLVAPGMSVQKIADTLAKEGVLDHPQWFVWWIGIKDTRAKLKAGEYLVKKGDTPNDLMNLLISGKVIQHAFTIVEGWNFDQLLQAVSEEPHLSHTLQGLTPTEVMQKLGYDKIHPEGRFFPETYYFPLNTSDIAFLQRAYRALMLQLNHAWDTRVPDLKLQSPEEVLILASIIEKESSVIDEYTDIAGVYIRRLARKMPLQADPTVIYGAGKAYTGKITASMLKQPTPYNTYLIPGLPPTPIAMPSGRALYAATHPKEGDTLYFVAKKDGKGHVFSKTLSEHAVNVGEYRKAKQGE